MRLLFITNLSMEIKKGRVRLNATFSSTYEKHALLGWASQS
ncbi:hypothetical protein FHR29_000729 [Sphingobacterium sp. JUb56]|nr:hypothetical protein [Sphingobacterium sp. JUb56]